MLRYVHDNFQWMLKKFRLRVSLYTVPFCHPHHAVTMASCLLPGYFGLLTRSCHVIQVDLRDRDAQELDTERFLSKNNGNIRWHNILRAFAQNARSDVKQAKTRSPYAKLYTTLIILIQLISLSERRRIRADDPYQEGLRAACTPHWARCGSCFDIAGQQQEEVKIGTTKDQMDTQGMRPRISLLPLHKA